MRVFAVGSVEDSVMLMDQITKRHRGFGFVTFSSEESVDLVCSLHYHNINNKKVECKRAQPKEAVMSANTARARRETFIHTQVQPSSLNLALAYLSSVLPPATAVPGEHNSAAHSNPTGT